MRPSPEQLLDALRAVPEPCSVLMRTPTDIVEMGLIESIELHGDEARVVLVLTDPSCVHFLGMQRYITDILTGLEGISSVRVTMSTSQLWTSDRVGAAAGAA